MEDLKLPPETVKDRFDRVDTSINDLRKDIQNVRNSMERYMGYMFACLCAIVAAGVSSMVIAVAKVLL